MGCLRYLWKKFARVCLIPDYLRLKEKRKEERKKGKGCAICLKYLSAIYGECRFHEIMICVYGNQETE